MTAQRLGPRVVVAGTHSGVGKTTVATGLMAALRRRGRRVSAAKVGPDFIDPGYHALATGRPGRNLDPWMCAPETIPALAGRAGRGADLLVVEGVMGLFDGAADRDPQREASTAHVARLLAAPVILVVDAAAMSSSVAAMVHGYSSFDPSIRVAGVILNRVASDGHEALLREALEERGHDREVPVLGALRRDDALVWRDRHLGLVPVVEQRTEIESALDRLAGTIERACDLEAIEAIAASAEPLTVGPEPTARPVGRAVVAVAAGPAFSFAYPDNLELLEQAGAEIVPFDPMRDPALPDGATALVAGGGFPEIYAEALADNVPLLADVARRAADGLVIWAECGGLLWLCRSLDGRQLCGVVPADAQMTERLTMGYRRAELCVDTPIAPAGSRLRGHEFHYSTIEPVGDAIDLSSRFGESRGGFATANLLASYLHVHLASQPELAERFVACSGR